MSDGLQFWYHHSGISVPSLNEGIEWWRRVLGFEMARRFHIPSIPADVALLRNGPLHIELFEVPGANALPQERTLPDADVRTYGNKHVAFAVGSVREFAVELRRRGADIVWVKEMPHGSNIFIRDNFGNLIEFVEEPPPSASKAQL